MKKDKIKAPDKEAAQSLFPKNNKDGKGRTFPYRYNNIKRKSDSNIKYWMKLYPEQPLSKLKKLHIRNSDM